jgi:arabinogalactan oligomer/maltooligosaccharide transport system permease protein
LLRGTAIYLFILPALVPMLALVGLPLVQTIFFSFTNLKEKNFDLWTLGIEPIKDSVPACPGVAVRVQPRGPAAKAGVPDGACVVELGGEAPRNAKALERLIEKARRQYTNKIIASVKLTYVAPAATTTATASLKFERASFDWRIDPNRDNSTWGLVGLANYKRVLIPSSDSDDAKQFYKVLGVTVLWTTINVAFHYIFGFALALLLNRRVPGTRFYRVLLMLPWAVPAYVSAFSWRWLFNTQYGFFNVVLQKLGHSPIPWLSDSTWTFVAVTITNVWLGIPFMMVTLLAGMQAIPKDLYEAAEIDGCSRWQQTLFVTLPMLRPVSLTIILLGAIWTFNMFNVIWLVQGGGTAVEILATYAFRLFHDYHDYAGAATYGTLIFLLLLVFSLLYLKLLQREEDLY